MSAQLNGQAEREQLALEVQAEALRLTPPVNGPSLHGRLSAAWQRIRILEDSVALLRQQARENRAQFCREIARQREELGISDT